MRPYLPETNSLPGFLSYPVSEPRPFRFPDGSSPEMVPVSDRAGYAFFKRSCDLVFAALLLLLLSPALLLTALFLGAPRRRVIYARSRIGYQTLPFTIFKFETMVPDSHRMANGTMTIENDPRITPAGRILRKLKWDELPQLYNVLRGEMSFIGPRPLDQAEFDCYAPEIQAHIYSVRPGITGIGSIIFRNEDQLLADVSMSPAQRYQEQIAPYKGGLEMWYLANQSFRVDFILLLLTALTIVFPKNKLTARIFPSLPSQSA